MKNSVFILGTKYTIKLLNRDKDKLLQTRDGYCDETIKLIVVVNKTNYDQISDFSKYQKVVLRHEIIHAFLYESGLRENMHHPENDHDEQMLDWFASQYPKIKKVYQKLEIEE